VIDSADIEATLKDIQNQIDHNQHNLDNLLEQRKQIVIQGYNNGLSMIKIGQLLDVTRQRVYAIINTEEE
jgi:DNA-directed RNA polymerase specialized sigma subunit